MRTWTKAEVERLLSPKVSYMEIPDQAGGFSCGTCEFATPPPGEPGGYCINRSVRAPVSPEHGCCNLFFPAHGRVIFPPQ